VNDQDFGSLERENDWDIFADEDLQGEFNNWPPLAELSSDEHLSELLSAAADAMSFEPPSEDNVNGGSQWRWVCACCSERHTAGQRLTPEAFASLAGVDLLQPDAVMREVNAWVHCQRMDTPTWTACCFVELGCSWTPLDQMSPTFLLK
jgi:hypothetical protein